MYRAASPGPIFRRSYPARLAASINARGGNACSIAYWCIVIAALPALSSGSIRRQERSAPGIQQQGSARLGRHPAELPRPQRVREPISTPSRRFPHSPPRVLMAQVRRGGPRQDHRVAGDRVRRVPHPPRHFLPHRDCTRVRSLAMDGGLCLCDGTDGCRRR